MIDPIILYAIFVLIGLFGMALGIPLGRLTK